MKALALVLLFSSCTSVTPYVITGESLKVLGNQAADTSEAMNKALDAGTVKPEEYRAWAEFAKRFKLFYPVAVDAWHAALAINDKVLAGQLGEAIGRLAVELGKFVAKVNR